MNVQTLLLLSLTFLQTILESFKVHGAPIEVIQQTEGAIAALMAVKDTPVTWEQLNDLRVQPTWTVSANPPTSGPVTPE